MSGEVLIGLPESTSPRRMGRAQRNPLLGGGEMGFGYRLSPLPILQLLN